MNRRGLLGAALLVVLAGVPVAGSVCAALCSPGVLVRDRIERRADPHCHGSTATGTIRIETAAGDRCRTHGDAVPDVPALAAAKRAHAADRASTIGLALTAAFGPTRIASPSSSQAPASPPGGVPASQTPLVLRV